MSEGQILVARPLPCVCCFGRRDHCVAGGDETLCNPVDGVIEVPEGEKGECSYCYGKGVMPCEEFVKRPGLLLRTPCGEPAVAQDGDEFYCEDHKPLSDEVLQEFAEKAALGMLGRDIVR